MHDLKNKLKETPGYNSECFKTVNGMEACTTIYISLCYI